MKKHIFPVKYRNYEFKIIAHSFVERQQNVDEYSDSLFIYGFDFASDIIKHFGESIQKVVIFSADQLSADQSAELHSNLNEYGSDSLTHLDLQTMQSNTFAQFKKPFSKLNTLNVLIANKQIEIPRLQKLRLEFSESMQNYDFDDITFIAYELRHMKQLEIRVDVRKNSLPAVHKQNWQNWQNVAEKSTNSKSFVHI